MEFQSRQTLARTWLGRLAWLAGGALFVVAGLWIVPPCVTHRIELINTENAPADVELSLVTGWGETSLWRGRLDRHYVRDLAFDLGRGEGHYRLKGRYVDAEMTWDRSVVYVTTNYDMNVDVILVAFEKIETKRRSNWRQCGPDDIRCAVYEIAMLAPRVSRCMVKGREAGWR